MNYMGTITGIAIGSVATYLILKTWKLNNQKTVPCTNC